MSVFNLDDYKGNIITTRVRLARNLAGYPFRIKEKEETQRIARLVESVIYKREHCTLFFMDDLSQTEKEAMKERHLISNLLIKNSFYGAALVGDDESLSIMIHEEDILREQCFMRGLCLKEAYKRLKNVDCDIFNNFDVAFDNEFGYLTACPTNVGTGLRASVMLFLPALTESGKIVASLKNFENLGLTVRGAYGEGSGAEGLVYQISNEITTGKTEEEILTLVEQTVIAVCKEERAEEERLYLSHELQTMDRVKRAFGLLTNAMLLSYDEFLKEIASIRLGAMWGHIDIADIGGIDDLTIKVRPANLCLAYNREHLTEIEDKKYRAEQVKKILLKLKG